MYLWCISPALCALSLGKLCGITLAIRHLDTVDWRDRQYLDARTDSKCVKKVADVNRNRLKHGRVHVLVRWKYRWREWIDELHEEAYERKPEISTHPPAVAFRRPEKRRDAAPTAVSYHRVREPGAYSSTVASGDGRDRMLNRSLFFTP